MTHLLPAPTLAQTLLLSTVKRVLQCFNTLLFWPVFYNVNFLRNHILIFRSSACSFIPSRHACSEQAGSRRWQWRQLAGKYKTDALRTRQGLGARCGNHCDHLAKEVYVWTPYQGRTRVFPQARHSQWRRFRWQETSLDFVHCAPLSTLCIALLLQLWCFHFQGLIISSAILSPVDALRVWLPLSVPQLEGVCVPGHALMLSMYA